MTEQRKEIEDIAAKSRDVPDEIELNQLVIQLRDKTAALISRANNGIQLVTVIILFFFLEIFEKMQLINGNFPQGAIQAQNQRKAEIESYQLLLTEIETWLKSIVTITAVERIEIITEDEPNTVAKIAQVNDIIKNLKEKEKKLTAIQAKCNTLSEFADVSPLSSTLSQQLTLTIEFIREQLRLSTTQLQVLELYLKQLRERPVITPLQDDETIGSSPMPEHEIMPQKPIEVETQTSHIEILKPGTIHVEQQTSFPIENKPTIETFDMSVQTSKEKKPTENIHVTQTTSEGHETIKIESVPNPNVSSITEDVFVDAKYQQPGDPKKTSELVLRNVPTESFETIFVEPDETTTEVIVEPDGSKRIIVRKLIRSHHKIVQQQQQQQFTTISSVVDGDNVPITQAVTQLNIENQSSTVTVADAGGSKTTSSSQSRSSIATGDRPDNLVIQEVFQGEPQIEEHVTTLPQTTQQIEATTSSAPVSTVVIDPITGESSIQTVIQHVTRRVIRKKRRIIRKVVIIDGKEHVTEEVIEEPEEVEITEDETPNVNVNIIRTINGRVVSTDDVNQPIVELAPDDAQLIGEPCPVVQDIVEVKADTSKKPGKKSRARKEQEKQVKDETKDVQVLEFESAPVELKVVDTQVNVANVVEEITNVSLPASETKVTETIIEETLPIKTPLAEVPPTEQVDIINIEEIWPPGEAIVSTPPSHRREIIEISSTSIPIEQDTIASKDIWPIDEKTGTPFEIKYYEFEVKNQTPLASIEELIPEIPVEIVQEVIENVIRTPEIIEASEKTEAEILPQDPKKLQPKIDVRSATQMFIEHELNVSDPTSRTVTVSMPQTKKSPSPGSVKVTMKVEPSEQQQPKLQVNIVEEVTQQKFPSSVETPSIDPSVIESVDLIVEDDDTISEKLNMPEIEPVDTVKVEVENVVSPDETYRSIETPSHQESVRIIEESVVQSPTEEAPKLPAEVVFSTEILEEKAISDSEQQTSPIQIAGEEKPTITVTTEVRSQQTSPEVKQGVSNAEQQTTPEAQVEKAEQENQTEIHVSEIHIQTSPRSDIDEHKPKRVTFDVASEEVQTDELQKPTNAEVSVQTFEVQTKEQQTSPQKEKPQVIPAADVVPIVAKKLVTDIVTEMPVQIPHQTEAINTEIVQTVSTVTQTIEEQPKSIDSSSEAASSSSKDPLEIEVEASVSIPGKAKGKGKTGKIDIVKSFVVDVFSKGKKNKKKKNKKDKQLPLDVSPSQIDDFIQTERNNSIIETPDEYKPDELVVVETVETSPSSVEIIELADEPAPTTTEITEIDSSLLPEDSIKSPLSKVVQLDIKRTIIYDTLRTDHLQQKHSTQTKHVDEDQKPKDVWESTCIAIADRTRNLKRKHKFHLSNVMQLAMVADSPEQAIQHRIETVQMNIRQLNQALEKRQIVIIQRTVITVIETISTLLETVEQHVFLTRQNSNENPSPERINEMNDLKKNLTTINESVVELSNSLNRAKEFIEPEISERMDACFANLQQQVQAVEAVTQEQNQEVQNDLDRWTEYVTLIETTIITITRLQQTLETITTHESPIENRLQHLDQLEKDTRQQIAQISKAMNTSRDIVRDFPSKQLPQDIHASYENARSLENAIALERQKLLQLQSLALEYEQTLSEFAHIIVLADSLVDQPINTNTLNELQHEIQKHLKFFVTFSHCRNILESLEQNVDNETRIKNADLHKSLHSRATQILEKASERAQRLSLAASRWTVLEKKMNDELHWLQVAQQRIPDLSEVTSTDYDRYITLYQSLNADISHHHAKILQLVNISDQLQTLVNAPRLCEENYDKLNALLLLRDEASNHLQRLLTFRETWTTYENLTDRLEDWMKRTDRELSTIDIPKDLRTQPIENMRQFWEIKVHFEVNNNQLKEIGENLEKSVEVLPIADEILQRQFHAQLEDRWTKLSDRINNIQTAIVNSISDQDVPLDEKLALLRRELEEIESNVISVKPVLKNEDELNLYIERMQVLNSRIVIICNELGRIGMLPSSEPEQVGELFAYAHSISMKVNEELENASILRDRLVAIQRGIRRMQQSQENTSALLDQCESNEKSGSEQVEMAISDCKNIAEELQLQLQEIIRLRQLLHTLPMRLRVTVSPIKVDSDLSRLQDEHAVLESRCTNILATLKNRLLLWRRFERQLELVQQSTNETDYMVELLKVNGQVDYERLRKATERLKVSTIYIFFFTLFFFYLTSV